jgi:hypothetical protein
LHNKPESPADAIIFLDFHKTWKMKKALLFFLLQLIWICLLIGGLFLYHNSITFAKSPPTIITIKRKNPQNDSLILDPDASRTVPGYKWKKVTWNIDLSSNVDSFYIEKKPDSKQIFILGFHPPSTYTTSGWGTVDPLRNKGTEYNYTIFYKMRGDNKEHTFDPKIAVNSNTVDFFELLIFILYGVLAILTFGFFRKAKNSIGT